MALPPVACIALLLATIVAPSLRHFAVVFRVVLP
jgi:hypothetical protein